MIDWSLFKYDPTLQGNHSEGPVIDKKYPNK